MSSGDPNRQARYIKDAGHQIGSFAAKAITELKLPSPTPDRAALAGGVAVLAWSSGTLFLTSLLAHAKTLPKDEYALLSQYVRTAVIFGTSECYACLSSQLIEMLLSRSRLVHYWPSATRACARRACDKPTVLSYARYEYPRFRTARQILRLVLRVL